MSLADGGSELMRDYELDVTPRFFVTFDSRVGGVRKMGGREVGGRRHRLSGHG